MLIEGDSERGGGERGDAGGVGGELGLEGFHSSEAMPGLRGVRGGDAKELRDAGKWSSVLSFVTAPEAERWVVGNAAW